MGIKAFLRINCIPIIVFFLLSLIFISPIFLEVQKTGIVNWDLWTFYTDAARLSVLEYGQFPFWNPYYCGGNILFAHPESFFLSPTFLFALLFGTVIGIKISLFFHLLIGLLGMYLLAKEFKLSLLASYTASFLYIFSAQFAVRSGAGLLGTPLGMPYLPWIFLFFLKGLKDRRYIIFSSLFLVLALFSGGIYEVAFFSLFILIYSIIKSLIKKSLKPIILVILIFAFSFLFASIKLTSTLDFVHDNPRTADFSSDESIALKDFYDYIIKSTTVSKYYPGGYAGLDDPKWWEGVIGIGWIGALLVILGLFTCIKKEKPLLFTVFIFILIFLGKTLPISLWRLLHFAPIFDSLYVIERLAPIIIFGFSLLAGFGFSRIKKTSLAIIILISLLLSLFFMNMPALKDATKLENPKLEKSNSFFQTIKNYSYEGEGYASSHHLLALRENKGDLACSVEEIRPSTSVSAIPIESAYYLGEAYIENGKAEIIYFSPNKIIVKTESDNDGLLIMNQNYEKNWKVNPGLIENYNGLLSVKISAGENLLSFTYFPKIFIIGLIITVFSLILAYLFYNGGNKNIIFLLIVLLILFELFFIYSSKNHVDIPEIYSRLNQDAEGYKIIDIPFTSPSFHAFRYYNEQHNKEVIWHHPSDPITYDVHLLKKIFLADDKIDEITLSDIVVQDINKISLSVLNNYNVKKIILHKKWYGDKLDYLIFGKMFITYDWSKYKDWYGNEHYNKTKELLDELLVKNHEDEDTIVYDVPIEKNPGPFILMGDGWYGLEEDTRGKFGWIKDSKAFVEIISPDKRKVKINFGIDIFHTKWTINLLLNGNPIDGFIVDKRINITRELEIDEGKNKLEFKIKEKCIRPIDVGENEDKRCLNVAIENIKLV